VERSDTQGMEAMGITAMRLKPSYEGDKIAPGSLGQIATIDYQVSAAHVAEVVVGPEQHGLGDLSGRAMRLALA